MDVSLRIEKPVLNADLKLRAKYSETEFVYGLTIQLENHSGVPGDKLEISADAEVFAAIATAINETLK